MKFNSTVKLLDKNPQLAHQLHMMTGSQMHYAQRQLGIIDNTINPNKIYDSTVTKEQDSHYIYHHLHQIDLMNRLQRYLNHQYTIAGSELYKTKKIRPSKLKSINRGTLALKTLNLKEWNKINDILDHSKVKHNSINVKQFNSFSNHKQHTSQPKNKKHHDIRDVHEAYEDTTFGRDVSTDASTQTIHPIATHGIQGVGKLKSLALRLNPAVITGILVAKQMIDSIKRHHNKQNMKHDNQGYRSKVQLRPTAQKIRKSQLLRQRRYNLQQSKRYR